MPLPISLRAVVDELNLGNDEICSYLHCQTGELVTLQLDYLSAAEEGADPADYRDEEQKLLQLAIIITETDDYLRLPGSFEIQEPAMMEDFCYAVKDSDISDDLIATLRNKNGFHRFKEAIHRWGIVADWHHFRDGALADLAEAWLQQHHIPYTNDMAARRG